MKKLDIMKQRKGEDWIIIDGKVQRVKEFVPTALVIEKEEKKIVEEKIKEIKEDKKEWKKLKKKFKKM